MRAARSLLTPCSARLRLTAWKAVSIGTGVPARAARKRARGVVTGRSFAVRTVETARRNKLSGLGIFSRRVLFPRIGNPLKFEPTRDTFRDAAHGCIDPVPHNGAPAATRKRYGVELRFVLDIGTTASVHGV